MRNSQPNFKKLQIFPMNVVVHRDLIQALAKQKDQGKRSAVDRRKDIPGTRNKEQCEQSQGGRKEKTVQFMELNHQV